MVPAALLLGTLALLLVLAILRAFASAPVAAVKRTLVYGAAGLGILLAGGLVAIGRGPQVIWLLALFGPLAWQWWRGRRLARRFGGGDAGQETRVETAMLAMVLDHASGGMSGRVLAGRFAGTDLAGLDLAALRDLLAECAARDPDSVPLLEAWLDRLHAGWREAPPSAGVAPMSRTEALAILGLKDGAGPEAVRAAHRRLMRTAHPDQGGSDWLAARLNAARDLLLHD
ncbi:MAG TPA: hypothetical protein VGM87_02650 [Roseomonas sp.]|jgi:hypothetical protein